MLKKFKSFFIKNPEVEKMYKLKYLKSESSLFVHFVVHKFFSFPPDKIDIKTLSFLFDDLAINDYLFLNSLSKKEISYIYYTIIQMYNIGIAKSDADKFEVLKRELIVFIAKIFDKELGLLKQYTDKDIINLFISIDTFKSKL